MRINQYIARCGISSRREAEHLVANEEISVNDNILTDLSYRVQNSDIVKYKGEVIKLEEDMKIYLFNKPTGHLTTRVDPQERNVIYDILPQELKNFITIGRLDMNSEGLLILTNDRNMKELYENPANKIVRTYKIRVYGRVQESTLKELDNEMEIEGMIYAPIKYKILKIGFNSWLELSLIEGKNREIRRVMEFLGYQVNRLIRTSYGKYSLGDIAPGKIKLVD